MGFYENDDSSCFLYRVNDRFSGPKWRLSPGLVYGSGGGIAESLHRNSIYKCDVPQEHRWQNRGGPPVEGWKATSSNRYRPAPPRLRVSLPEWPRPSALAR